MECASFSFLFDLCFTSLFWPVPEVGENKINKRDITEGKCRHYLFGLFSIQFQLFAEEYSKLNENPLNICQKYIFTCLGGLVVECKASYLEVTGSNPIIFP